MELFYKFVLSREKFYIDQYYVNRTSILRRDSLIDIVYKDELFDRMITIVVSVSCN